MIPIEIERKFLIEQLPEFVLDCPNTTIEQSYISVNPEIRVRREDDKYIITKKGEGTLCRSEEEKFISEVEYKSYLYKAVTHPIYKKRYYVPIKDGYVAEVDVFEGYLKGLVTAEVEFASVISSEVFIPPIWFGKEITDDKSYKNKNLSKLKL